MSRDVDYPYAMPAEADDVSLGKVRGGRRRVLRREPIHGRGLRCPGEERFIFLVDHELSAGSFSHPAVPPDMIEVPVGVEDKENLYSVCLDGGKDIPGICSGVDHDTLFRFTVSKEVAVDPQLSHHYRFENHVSSLWICFPAAGKGCAED